MRLIGITGSIACGKSTVSRELFRRGYPVIDGDVLARELTAPGGAALAEIRSVFGDQYISADGSLNRRQLGQLVFSDPEARARLDRLMGPFLRNLTMERIDQARSSGASLCFLDMPLLYEKGYDRYCDAVWCVWLPEDLQLRRLMERDGFSQEDALKRMRSVMSSDRKADLASVVIDNSGSVEDTLRQVSEQLQVELRRSEASSARRRRVPVQESVPVQHPVKPAEPLYPEDMNEQKHLEEQEAIDNNYPLYYAEEIRKTAAEYHLSPALVAAVIRNESSFRPTIESPVGAMGLMQLMPATAEWIAGKLHVDNYSFNMMKDPAKNIRFGCWYLSYLSSLFNSDPYCVVCAYHAGQGEVTGWLSNPLYSSDHKTLIPNNLPEGPTKQYAGRVTRDYGIYQAKYYDQEHSVMSPGSDTAAD